MPSFTVQNGAKLIVAVVVIICCTVLLAVGAIDQGTGMSPITLVIGYILGNGVAAIKGEPVTPIIGSKNDTRAAITD